MADNILVRLVYPGSDTTLLVPTHLDAKAIRAISDKVTRMPTQLTLFSPPKEDLAGLAQRSSPHRFERADIAERFFTERPERGDAKVWREATEKDAALGEVVVLVDALTDWAERALVATLVELSEMTGRIEKSADALRGDPKALGEVSAFQVADLERARMDQSAEGLRDRVSGHLDEGAAEARRMEAEDQRAVSARRLQAADPQRLVAEPLKVKKKGKGPEGGAG